MLERTLRVNRLYDAYGDLLTDKQGRVLRRYFQEDWSLSEIAREEGCSRQAVHDLLSRSTDRLSRYEEELSHVERMQSLRSTLRAVRKCVDEPDRDLERARTLLDGLLKDASMGMFQS